MTLNKFVKPSKICNYSTDNDFLRNSGSFWPATLANPVNIRIRKLAEAHDPTNSIYNRFLMLLTC